MEGGTDGGRGKMVEGRKGRREGRSKGSEQPHWQPGNFPQKELISRP